MRSFRLLQEVGRRGKPVLLKPHPGCRIRELLMASEYIMPEGNPNVVLCARGITTFEDMARYTVDVNAVPAIKRFSHLPVIAAPSHATGDWRYVTSAALAAIVAGADGMIVEVRPDPAALSDGPQSLRPGKLAQLMRAASQVGTAVGRELPLPAALG